MEEPKPNPNHNPYSHLLDSDNLDLSFTSTTTTTHSSPTPRSSLTLSSLSFNDRLSNSTTIPHRARPHRRLDPLWSPIRAATSISSDGILHLRHLHLLRLLGSGNLGRVFLCRLRHHPSLFALKVVDLDSLSSKHLSHVHTEAKVLSLLDHPFLPTLYARIDVSHYTCLLLDYCPGGDLHSLLRKQPSGRLPLQAVRFYAAEILLALEYLHSLGIVYRDLKPENILLREDGHVMLSDFDLCFTSDVAPRIQRCRTTRRKSTASVRSCLGRDDDVMDDDDDMLIMEPTGAYSKSCVGTHEYLAPEVVNGTGHGNAVDWWAFGVLIYELMYGTTPFKGVNKEATLRNIASSTRNAEFCVGEDHEEALAAAARDLVGRLLTKEPRKRMGTERGAAEIKRHPFFQGLKWALIREYRPPEMRGGVVRVGGSNATWWQKRRRTWWRRGLSYLMRREGSSGSSSRYGRSNSYVSVNNKHDNYIVKK